jgi:hypothetical protein
MEKRLGEQGGGPITPMRKTRLTALTEQITWRSIRPTLADSSANHDPKNHFRKGLRHMKRLSARFGTALVVMLAVAASQVQAEYLNWTYTANPNVAGISVGNNSPKGGAAVTLTNFNTPQAGAASIPVIAYVTSTSSTTPVTFGPSTNLPPTYNLALTITDKSTGDSAKLNFTGSLVGSLTATSSSVVASFKPVTSDSVTLDGHTYTVTIPTVTLAAPTSPQQDIMANVSVTGASTTPPGGGGGSSQPPTQSTPEPASLLLGSLGFSCFGLGCWWKRRRPA